MSIFKILIYLTLDHSVPSSVYCFSASRIKLAFFWLAAPGKQVWTASVHNLCVGEDHIRDGHSLWHHTDPKQEKNNPPYMTISALSLLQQMAIFYILWNSYWRFLPVKRDFLFPTFANCFLVGACRVSTHYAVGSLP